MSHYCHIIISAMFLGEIDDNQTTWYIINNDVTLSNARKVKAPV